MEKNIEILKIKNLSLMYILGITNLVIFSIILVLWQIFNQSLQNPFETSISGGGSTLSGTGISAFLISIPIILILTVLFTAFNFISLKLGAIIFQIFKKPLKIKFDD